MQPHRHKVCVAALVVVCQVEALLPYVFNPPEAIPMTIVDVVTTIADADIVIRLELLAGAYARDFGARIMRAERRAHGR